MAKLIVHGIYYCTGIIRHNRGTPSRQLWLEFRVSERERMLFKAVIAVLLVCHSIRLSLCYEIVHNQDSGVPCAQPQIPSVILSG